MSLDKRSIELGDGQWAVKEDKLFAFRKDRDKFFERSFDFSRASEGTIINSDGHIQYSGFGDELITNGGFDTDSDWIKGVGYTIGNGNLVATNTADNALTFQNKTYPIGVYRVTANVNITSGAVRFQIGGAFISESFTTSGLKTVYISVTSQQSYFGINTDENNSNFSIDNVSVKKVEQETPRISYDIVDGVVSDEAHLLLEPQRTNLVQYSENFSASWGFDDASATPNTYTSPDGLMNATTLKGNSNSSRHYTIFAKAGATSAAFSVFLKAKELRYVQIASANTTSQHANFDVLDGVIGNVGSGFSDAKIEDYGNGWYRCSVVSVNQYNNIYISLVTGLDSPWLESWSMPNSTDGLYIWGAQIEEGSYATSYIPNYGTTNGVTRSAETANNSGNVGDFNDDEGVLYFESQTLNSSQTEELTIAIGDTTDTNMLRVIFNLAYNGEDSLRVRIDATASASFYRSYNTLGIDPTDFNRYAVRYSGSGYQFYLNGKEIVSGSVNLAFATNDLERLAFGRSGGGGSPFYGKVKDLKVYTETLNDAELRLLTKYAPKDYDVAFTADYVDTVAEINILRTEATDKLYYVISDGANEVSGSATITATEVTISNIDISSLNDGTLTVSVYIEDERKQRGVTVTDTTIKDNTNTPLYSYALQQRATGAVIEELDNAEAIIESLNVEV